MTRIRGELIRLLADLSDEAPDLRLGQMVANLATQARGTNIEVIWDTEDEEFEATAQRLLEHYRKRHSGVA